MSQRVRTDDYDFFLLERSVQPGGLRFAALDAYVLPKHVLRVIEVSAGGFGPTSLAHLAWYGLTFLVWRVEAGAVTEALDVRPFIRLSMFGRAKPLHLWSAEEIEEELSRSGLSLRDIATWQDGDQYEAQLDISALSDAIHPLPFGGLRLPRGAECQVRVASSFLAGRDTYLLDGGLFHYGTQELEHDMHDARDPDDPNHYANGD